MPDRSHSQSRWKPALLPALIVGTGAVLALVVWTIPNWGIFAQHVSQFPALWQVNSNRYTMIALIIKICSPLIIGAILSTACWLYSTVQSLLLENKETTSTPGPQSQISANEAPIEQVEQVEGQRLTLPITPIPPMFYDL